MIRVHLYRLGDATHLFSCVIHHIVADGWSIGVFAMELGRLYNAFSSGQKSPLPEIAIQYKDFAHWQRAYLSGDVFEKQKNYWLERLKNFETLTLPKDRPRPEIPTFKGGNVGIEIDPELTRLLYKAREKTNCSLFMLLMSAFAALLSRYSGQDDVVTGTAIANRNRKDIEPLIGFFVNTLILRFDFSKEVTVKAFIAQAREIILDAYANQDFPFEKLVEVLVPERELGGYPISQVNLTFQNMPLSMPEMKALTIEGVNPQDHTVRFDLEIDFWEQEDRILGHFRYASELFNRSTIERMASHFKVLLFSMLENPDARVSDLAMLTESEITSLHALSGNTTPVITEKKLLPELFRKQAQLHPKAIALICEDRQMTYEELETYSNQVAACLTSKGAGPGNLIGLCMNRSIETMASLIGIFKSGSVYVPIDPDYPQERISYIIKDAGLRTILTQDAWVAAGLFEGHDLDMICREQVVGKITDMDFSSVSQEKGDANDPAYVIYTSGSTGNPKGILVSKQSLSQHCLNAAGFYRITEKDRVLEFASLSFDPSLEQVFVTLIKGASP
ncbi:MAG: AMP-binding protein [Proteobacteria bacterium]|nr:AMP-binding protein [Pseudomonadota bacterium]